MFSTLFAHNMLTNNAMNTEQVSVLCNVREPKRSALTSLTPLCKAIYFYDRANVSTCIMHYEDAMNL